MLVAKIFVSGISIRARIMSLIPEGIVGATVEFVFSSEWSSLNKTVVFGGCETKDVLNAGTTVEIPAEVVARTGCRLRVGIYGTDYDNRIAIPTLWCDLGPILDAADPSGDTSTNPALPVWAQLNSQIPFAEVEQTEDGAAVTIGNIYGTNTVYVRNGKDGAEGRGILDIVEIDEGVLDILFTDGTMKSFQILQGADGKDGADGQPGADGFSPTVAVSKSGKVTTVSITDKNGTKTATINDGADGKDGVDGADGRGISDITEIDEGVMDILFTDGTMKSFPLPRGEKGEDGVDGKDGNDGADGKDGYTPVKGVDYFTEEDINGIVDEAVAEVVVETILPETPLHKGMDGSNYDSMEEMLLFNIQKQIVAGEEYNVTINGVTYTAAATVEQYDDGRSNICLDVGGYSVYYNKDGLTFDDSYNCGVAPIDIDEGHTVTVSITHARFKDGADGYSPTVSVEDIDGGHRVTITDINGAKSFDVMDGKDAQVGSGAGANADWSINDPNVMGYVKNRTHFIEPGATIFPETYLIDGNPGYWDNMELVYYIADCPGSLVAGKAYVVTINGTAYIGVAYKREEIDDIIVDSATGKFTIYYNPSGVSFIPDEKLVLVPNYLADPYTWEPITLSIKEIGNVQKLSPLFLDMDAICAALPSVKMTATFDDGSTGTFKLYGEAVTE